MKQRGRCRKVEPTLVVGATPIEDVPRGRRGESTRIDVPWQGSSPLATLRGGPSVLELDLSEESATRCRLPIWFAYVVGALKVAAALALIAGIWLPALVLPAGAVVCVLMVGAIAMHAKVRDPLRKSLRAVGMLVLCLGICWGAARDAGA